VNMTVCPGASVVPSAGDMSVMLETESGKRAGTVGVGVGVLPHPAAVSARTIVVVTMEAADEDNIFTLSLSWAWRNWLRPFVRAV
jgi:hypothetical protein